MLFRPRHITLLSVLLLSLPVAAQELLLPLSSLVGVERNTTTPKLGAGSLQLPFFDDFSAATSSLCPDASRWEGCQAWVNSDFAPLPPTLGMITLDVLDETGNLYPHASTSSFGADTLTSRIIRLDSLFTPVRRTLSPADSIRLSFFYLPGGWYGNPWERVGDTPASQDSLILEFFSPADTVWCQVWASPGFEVDTTGVASGWPWHFASIAIDDARFFSSDFRFRFRNLATLDPNPKAGIAANCDQWNIDYILLDYGRRAADSTFRDVAFVAKAPSLLRRYQAMPARQYVESEMASILDVTLVNRYHQTLASTYSFRVSGLDNAFSAYYDGGYENIPAFFPKGQYQTQAMHAHPHIYFAFPLGDEPASYLVTHIVSEGVSGDNCRSNDTTSFLQVFDNYYAYDDGFPENGYGITTIGSKAWLAVRYDLHVADTLTALDLFFNRTRGGENESVPFVICVWEAGADGKPGQLLYKDEVVHYPQFDTLLGFCRFALSQPLVVGGSIFVGLEQQSNAFVNLGFDRSNNARDYTYYRTGNEWYPSILAGAVMLRPLFGSRAMVGINAPAVASTELNIYPNPADTYLHIEVDNAASADCSLMVYDLQGRVLYGGPVQTGLDVSCYPQGVYLLRLYNQSTGACVIKKLIIK